MKKLFFLTLVFIATSSECFAQNSEIDSLKADSIAKKFIGNLQLKPGANEGVFSFYKEDNSTKMEVHLLKNRIEIFCYVCKTTNRLFLIKSNGHYWIHYEKGLEQMLQETIEEFLSVRS